MDAAVAESNSTAEARLRARRPDPQLPGWWNQLRARAIEQYFATPLPERTNENWHYGDAKKFQLGELQVGAKHASPAVTTGQAATTGEACFAPTNSGDVHVTTLTDALKALGDEMERYFSPGLQAWDHFVAQHFALLESGYFVHAPKNAATAEELHLSLPAPGDGQVGGAHVLIVAEPFASLDVYLHLTGGGAEARSLSLPAVQAYVGAGAQVRITRVQHFEVRTDALVREAATLDRDAQYTSLTVQLGGMNVRSECHVELAGPGASARLSGAYFADGRQRFDFLTHQNHAAPHTTSNLLYKGALLGRSRASYQGMITVAPHAQRTDAYQSNRALVLSGSARADSSPQLEIGANDVRCTHGSTVSNVSEHELFYMRSRGIPREQARRMLVTAFVSEVVDRIGSAPVREQVQAYLMEHNA